MLIVVGFVLWVSIGVILGLTVKSQAFAQGWSEVVPDPNSAGAPETTATDDQYGRRLLIAGTLSAVVAGLVSMVVIIGETLVGLLISLPVAVIGAGAVLLIMSAMGLTAVRDDDFDDGQTPLDQ